MPLFLFQYARSLLATASMLLLISCANNTDTKPELIAAIRWYTGEDGVVDDARARELLELAASSEDTLSIMWLAREYSTGSMTFPADKSKAKEVARTVIEDVKTMGLAGVAEANFLMGTAYAEGLGVEIDSVEAVKGYRRAAASGNTLALHNLSNVYFSGLGVTQSDAEAAHW